VNGYARLLAAALAVVPGPDGTVTFVRQLRGPYAGHWLLPGGRVEFGESLPDAARRETLEEAGCTVGDLTLIGSYELRGRWREGSYHLITFAFLTEAPVTLPAPRTTDGSVGEIVQAVPAEVQPHPTVMRVLNDAGLASFPEDRIDAALRAAGIAALRLHTGAPVRAG
jgi:8-oxo-dGTP diphosphatase